MLTAVGWQNQVGRVEGLSQKEKKRKKIINMDNSMVIVAGREGGGRWRVEEGRVVMDGDLTWGGKHTTQGTGDVLWNCAPGPCII